jgi:tRNA (mo5U34)-methyltransferase
MRSAAVARRVAAGVRRVVRGPDRYPAPPVPTGPREPFALDDTRLEKVGFDRASLAKEIGERKWFHVFDFGDGLETPGRDVTEPKLAALELPDLTGKSVIDIGTYDGYFSFESERRGAARVVANDHWAWTWPGEDARRNFDLVREVLDSRVEALTVPVEELDGAEHGTFDVALFLGVLYHAPDMIRYLRAVRSVTKGMLVLETMVDALDIDRPAAIAYPTGTFPNDDSNHWGPNPACVEALLHRVGFSRVERRGLWERGTLQPQGAGPRRSRHPTDGRMVFHAWV